jgi:hypothetical protein
VAKTRRCAGQQSLVGSRLPYAWWVISCAAFAVMPGMDMLQDGYTYHGERLPRRAVGAGGCCDRDDLALKSPSGVNAALSPLTTRAKLAVDRMLIRDRDGRSF